MPTMLSKFCMLNASHSTFALLTYPAFGILNLVLLVDGHIPLSIVFVGRLSICSVSSISIVILLSLGLSSVTLYVLILVVFAIKVSFATDFIESLEPGVSVTNVLANCTVPISEIVTFAPKLILFAYSDTFENVTLVVFEIAFETSIAL